MTLKEKYQDNYILLAGLRQYVEKGTMLASVNFWRDSAQGYDEFDVIGTRNSIVQQHPDFKNNAFLVDFVAEDFPELDEKIPDNIVHIAFPLIEEAEGRETVEILKSFLIEYATNIAKASKEDWLAFIGMKDAVSDAEQDFIDRLKALIDY
jgi:hypothetical protein